MKKLISWLVWNGLYIFCLFAAMYWEDKGAYNIFVALTLLQTFTIMFILFNSEVQEKFIEQAKARPKYYRVLSNIYYTAIIAPLVYFGWGWLAAAHILSFFVILGTRKKVDDE